MRRNLQQFAVLCIVTMLLTGCFAAIGELGLAEVGVAAEAGAAAAGIEISALELGAADGIALRTLALESATLDVAPLGATSLRSLFARVAAEEGAGGALAVSNAGDLTAGGRVIGAVTRSGEIVGRLSGRGAHIIGRLSEGRVWSLNARGALVEPVAELRGAVPARGIWLRQGPSGNTYVDVLRPSVPFRVLELSNGWYRVQVLNSGVSGWVPAEALFVAVFPILAATDSNAIEWARNVSGSDSATGTERALVALTSGSTFRVRNARRFGATWRFETSSGGTVVASANTIKYIRADTQPESLEGGLQYFRISGGPPVAIFRCTARGQYAVLERADGSSVIVAQRLLDRACE